MTFGTSTKIVRLHYNMSTSSDIEGVFMFMIEHNMDNRVRLICDVKLIVWRCQF